MTELLRCDACGGAVVWDAAQAGAACLFCGTLAVELHALTEPLPEPDTWLPPRIRLDRADASFRAWARRSWFRPKGLASAELQLRPLLLPAWRVHGRLESHWAGLTKARTKSGWEPVTGVAQADRVCLIPASAGLDQAELSALLPFDETDARPWSDRGGEDEAEGEWIWEPPVLTRRGARAPARRALSDDHAAAIARDRGLRRCRVSALVEERDVSLVMLPIYIGVFRFRDRPWRILVHGQTGELVGDAPVDRGKVVALVVLGLAIAAAWLWFDAHR